MTIRQQGGVFGRNPTFNDVETNDLTVEGQLLQTGSENVGIGTASPNGSGTRKTVHIDGANGAAVRLSDASNSALLRYNTLGSLDLMTVGSVPLGLYTTNVERLNIAAGGDVTVKTGNLVIGTSGNGVDFSATSGTGTSELFDDYEEGVFTPTLTTDATDFSSVTYDEGVFGSYTKVGNVVHIQLLMQTDAVTKGSASGNVIIGGLPFAADGTSPLAVATSKDWLANHPTRAYVADGATTISLLTNANNTADDENVVVADVKTLGNDNTLRLSGTYRAS